MAIAEVLKISLVAHKQFKEAIIDLLYDQAIFAPSTWAGQTEKVTETKETEDTVSYDYQIAESKFAIDFLTKHASREKVSFLEKIRGQKIFVTRPEIEKLAKTYNYQKIIKQVEDLDEKINQIKGELLNLKEEKILLERWRKLKVKISEAKETTTSRAIFGIIDSVKYLDFIHDLQRKVKQIDIRKIHTEEKKDFLVIIYSKQLEKEVEKLFFSFDFEKTYLPDINTTPAQKIKDILSDEKTKNKELAKLEKEAQKIAKNNLKNLKIIFDYLGWQQAENELRGSIIETKKTFTLIGWIQKRDLKKLKKQLDKIAQDNYELKKIEPDPEEPVPIILRNKPAFSPFEAVTSIYGMPHHSEPDPTPFLAPFFIVFFALCLTDAGYGAVLALLSFLAIKILKVPREKQKLFRLLIFGGIVTFFIGSIFGGWFGIDISVLPDAIKGPLTKIQLMNPLEQPIQMLLLTLILGIIQVITGIIIQLCWNLKQKKVKEALLDNGLWLLFIAAILFWTLTATGILPADWGQIGKYLTIAGALSLVATQGRKSKNILLKIGIGVMSLYNLVGYISDVLSYSRLLALGLATGIIAMVVNLIAMLFKDMIPYVGWLVAILILIGGHLFNLAINVLGAYIHSGRLQFVEFFPKFMHGGGDRFKPFHRESRYITVVR